MAVNSLVDETSAGGMNILYYYNLIVNNLKRVRFGVAELHKSIA